MVTALPGVIRLKNGYAQDDVGFVCRLSQFRLNNPALSSRKFYTHSQLDTRVRVALNKNLYARWERRKDANPLKIRHSLAGCTDPECLGKRIAFISAAQ